VKEKSKELVVRKIERGTVIDHIPVGQALNVIRLLGIKGGEGYTVAVVMNVDSRKHGKKDIVKVEGKELSAAEVNRIALVAPEATINVIQDFEVVKKTTVKLPDRLQGMVRCTNPSCITNKPREPVTPTFRVLSRSPLLLLCEYCGTRVLQEDVIKQYAG
jgi:aspartate carbamoyltransferase regulatory subunit